MMLTRQWVVFVEVKLQACPKFFRYFSRDRRLFKRSWPPVRFVLAESHNLKPIG